MSGGRLGREIRMKMCYSLRGAAGKETSVVIAQLICNRSGIRSSSRCLPGRDGLRAYLAGDRQDRDHGAGETGGLAVWWIAGEQSP